MGCGRRFVSVKGQTFGEWGLFFRLCLSVSVVGPNDIMVFLYVIPGRFFSLHFSGDQ